MFSRRTAIFGAGAAGLLFASRGAAQSRSHAVEMLTDNPGGSGKTMVFSPRILRIAPGDSVTFKPVQGPHSCLSTPGMIPEGADGWRGQIGKPVTVTLSKPGYYGYHCLPHRSMGMVGLVIVGQPGRGANLTAARSVRHPAKAQAEWDAIWNEAMD